MRRLRVKVKFAAILGYYVDLPTYQMVDGSWAPVTANLLTARGVIPGADPAAVLALNPTVEVDVPEEDCTRAGAVDPASIKKRYAAWKDRANADV